MGSSGTGSISDKVTASASEDAEKQEISREVDLEAQKHVCLALIYSSTLSDRDKGCTRRCLGQGRSNYEYKLQAEKPQVVEPQPDAKRKEWEELEEASTGYS